MIRRSILLTVAAAFVVLLAACGNGVEENGGSNVTVSDTKPDTTDTTAANGATTTTAGDNSSIPPGQDPRNILGDDDALNQLAQDCFQGDMGSCDDLFSQTDVGSDLESYSQTCGGRIDEVEGAPNCASRFVEAGPAQQPSNLSDDPLLADSSQADVQNFEDLSNACFQGDFGSCDELFLQTPVDSDFEAYGSTCGGRLQDGVRGQCDSILGSGGSGGGSTSTTDSSGA